MRRLPIPSPATLLATSLATTTARRWAIPTRRWAAWTPVPIRLVKSLISATMRSDGLSARSRRAWPRVLRTRRTAVWPVLGLQHPGMHMFPDNPRPPTSFKPSPGTSPNAWEYDADPGSLMGRGMQLRIQDFHRAFCKHIKTKKSNCNPWCPIPPPWWM